MGPALVWAAAFALVAVAQRAVVLGLTAQPSPAPLAQIHLLATLPELMLVGLILALPLFAVENRGVLAMLWAVVTGVALAHGMAARYEAVFGRLPSARVVFYTHDSGELVPSLVSNAHPGLLVAELVVALTLLALVWRWVSGLRVSGWAPWLIVAVLVVAMGAERTVLDRVAAGHAWRHRSPLVWLVESRLRGGEIDIGQAGVGPAEVLWLQRQMGHEPFAGTLETAPLCAPTDRGSVVTRDPASAILVIMESVGLAELRSTHEGQVVMPHLQDFARRHLLFDRVKAAGTKSGSAMAPLFAGLPPQTYQHLLHRVPLNTMDGFPRLLADHGYRTVYLHGADLSWEFQRSFLRMMGFAEIIERDPRLPFPRIGWGWPDEVLATRLRDWVTESRQEDPERPYLATWFTLSTHDPYDLPKAWPRRFVQKDATDRLYESLAYLDAQLGDLFTWFEAEEAPRGTILILVGDHTPHLTNRSDTPQGPVFRFDVPLIVAGRSPAIAAARETWQHRLAGHQDIPATLLDALGLPTPACDQGVSLLSADEVWDDDRVIYSVGGEDLEEIQLWLGDDEHVLADRLFRGLVELAPDPGGEVSDRARRFLEVVVPLNWFLIERNAYAPPDRRLRLEREPLDPVSAPLVISHRGNVHGPGDGTENTLEAVARAVAAGFPCIEIDLQLTRDLIPVLHHDAMIVDRSGRERAVSGLDLAELDGAVATPPVPLHSVLDRWPEQCFVLEMKPQEDYDRKAAFGEAVTALTRKRSRRQRLIVDSFSPVQVAAIVPSAECEVGWDLPYRAPLSEDLIEAAVLAEVDWVFVEAGALTGDGVAAARRRGLRVMAYTIDDAADLARLAPELPDGLITDTVEMVGAVR